MILNHDVRERKLAKEDTCIEKPSKLGYVAKMTLAWYVLLVWFFLVLGASVSGWFLGPRGQPPVLLGLAVGVPILLGFLLFFASSAVRRFVRSINPVTITALQSYRVIGVATLVLSSWHQLPALFSMPVGWGGIFIVGIAPRGRPGHQIFFRVHPAAASA